MPYVTQQRRDELASGDVPRTPGDLTYLIYLAMISDSREAKLTEALDAAVERYMARGPLSYTTLNAVVGSLECARREFTRRDPAIKGPQSRWARVCIVDSYTKTFYWSTVAPYEDQKIIENGDVSPA